MLAYQILLEKNEGFTFKYIWGLSGLHVVSFFTSKVVYNSQFKQLDGWNYFRAFVYFAGIVNSSNFYFGRRSGFQRAIRTDDGGGGGGIWFPLSCCATSCIQSTCTSIYFEVHLFHYYGIGDGLRRYQPTREHAQSTNQLFGPRQPCNKLSVSSTLFLFCFLFFGFVFARSNTTQRIYVTTGVVT